jgi:tRNA nucleotidyltransferase/poly(A) polymerase
VLALVDGWASAVWDTGIAFGTVGLRRRGVTMEITTFRSDAYDRVSRNPVVAYGDTIEDDLKRRDFSVNAMALELTGGRRTFVDPFGGLAALAAGSLDTPATPEESFADDPLRMLRAARFVAQLGFTPAPRVVAAMTAMAGQLARITAERVQVELSKLLLGTYPRRGIELLVDTGLADVVLPEVPAMRLAIDEHMQHKDVYTHSLVVLEQAIGHDCFSRYADEMCRNGIGDSREYVKVAMAHVAEAGFGQRRALPGELARHRPVLRDRDARALRPGHLDRRARPRRPSAPRTPFARSSFAECACSASGRRRWTVSADRDPRRPDRSRSVGPR